MKKHPKCNSSNFKLWASHGPINEIIFLIQNIKYNQERFCDKNY